MGGQHGHQPTWNSRRPSPNKPPGLQYGTMATWTVKPNPNQCTIPQGLSLIRNQKIFLVQAYSKILGNIRNGRKIFYSSPVDLGNKNTQKYARCAHGSSNTPIVPGRIN